MKLFGGLLMAIGILIATLSGLCSAWILLEISGHSDGGRFSDIVSAIMIPGVPFMIGIGLILLGRSLVRGK